MSDRRHICFASCWGLVAGMLCLVAAVAAHAQGRSFPYDQELHLDADLARGAQRVPGLQISPRGHVEIDLWCVSGTGRAVIADNSITIVPTGMRDNQCSQDRLLRDKELLDQITQVTSWRWEGQMLVLVGPQSLRYRPASN